MPCTGSPTGLDVTVAPTLLGWDEGRDEGRDEGLDEGLDDGCNVGF